MEESIKIHVYRLLKVPTAAYPVFKFDTPPCKDLNLRPTIFVTLGCLRILILPDNRDIWVYFKMKLLVFPVIKLSNFVSLSFSDNPYLPELVLEQIILHSIRRSPAMRYPLRRVNIFFAIVINRYGYPMGYPTVYIHRSGNSSLPLEGTISVASLFTAYGPSSRVMASLRQHLLLQSGYGTVHGLSWDIGDLGVLKHEMHI